MSNVMECRNVVKTFYDGNRQLPILRGIDLTVETGKILSICGPSGAGKSTLLHLMGTLDKPTEGEILFNGKSFSSLPRREINRIRNEEIGFVFQFYHLLPEFSALENVMLPAIAMGASRKTCRARAEELLEKVGLSERTTHRPGKLSGGEQQRVAIARALYNNPSLILADEPTGNLDEKTGHSIMELLRRLNKTDNVTLVIVTHNMNLARQAHTTAHLHEGRAEIKTNSAP